MVLNVIISALLVTVISLFVGEIKPEYSFLIKIAGIIVIILWTLTIAADKINEFYSYFSGLSDISDLLKILVKAATVCMATSITSSVCRENGNAAIAQCVELFGRFAMFILCLPLIESAVSTALSLID